MASGTKLMAQSGGSENVSGVVRVKLQREVASRITQNVVQMSNGFVTTGVTPLDRVNRQVKAASMTRMVPYSPKFEEKHKRYGLDLWYEIRFNDEGVSPAEAKALYKGVAGIQKVENVRPVKPIGGEAFRPITPAEIAKVAKAASTPTFFNDPLMSGQWHYDNDGSLPGSVAGADIDASKAWEIETGKSDVIVAIVDGGIQYDHPDLAANMWVNEAELNGQPGVDDDGDGYVDDIYGYNFVTNSSDVYQHSHGTHVAGTVGAVNNNGVGVAGVAGGSGKGGVRLISCQIFDTRSSQNSNNLAALTYAADMGASIAQCSWGWDTADYYDPSTEEGVNYFTKEGGGDKMKGGLCIFATGNTGTEGNYYPACDPQVLSVAAMDAMLQPASYSTYGDWVDITAPGGNMDYGEKYGVLSTLPNSAYGYNEGTSMATPHVSGIAALVLSKYGNKDFTNEALRSQLQSSVNDFYTKNPTAEGKFGAGYIDAYKALQMGSGEAPEAVGDLTLTPSQDNILIEWTIPEAEEKSVDHHNIYYSTEPFTASDDLGKLKSVTVDTRFDASGDKKSYELGGLKSLTTYYIAISAVNRYGNVSKLSEVKSATTNAGPKVSVDKNTVSLNVDATSGSTATDEFTIKNDGEGLLRYSMSANTVKAVATTSSKGNPVPGKIVSQHGNVVAQAISKYPVVTADYNAQDYPKNFTYSQYLTTYIGDDDTEKPNAGAQYFYVDPAEYPDGFNLTHVNIGGAYGSDPVIEIYNGASSISKASLLQKVEYPYFAYMSDIQLSEQLYFAPGSSFWIVVKFPKGQQLPLGAGRMTGGKDVKQYSFYSNDNGDTWTQLSEVLRGGNLSNIADSLTWDMTAVSQNPDWSSVLNPTPAEGTVRPHESQKVTMSNDGQKMVNGTYTYNLYLNTNETEKPKQKIGVTMKVTGNKPELTSAKVIDFGDVLVGKSKTITVELANNGYGAFGGSSGDLYPNDGGITSSSDQFEVPSYMPGISARSTSTMDVTFKPTRSGSQSGTISLKSKDGIVYSFIVRGVSSMPAKVSVSPMDVDFGNLEVGGESKTQKLTIKNTGEYPLQYVFPKFSDETIEDAGAAHKFGYTYISNIDGSDEFAYDNNPELNSETDITSQFNDYTWQSGAVDLGFRFPFYGTNYSQVYITTHGSIIMQTKDGNISCVVPDRTCVGGLGYISAYGGSGKLTLGANSKITYGRQDGKFTVKFKDVLAGSVDGGTSYVPVSFHMSLSADGSIECFYDDYEPANVFDAGKDMFLGVVDIDAEDPFIVYDVEDYLENESSFYEKIRTGTAVKIVAPSKSMVSSVSSPSGVVNIGESKEITVTATATEGMYAGELSNSLTLLTNDPETPGTYISLKANITGDNLKPKAEFDADVIDFGEVFRTSKAVKTVLLSNNGTDKLNVESVAVTGGKFTVAENISKPFTIDAGTGKDLAFTLPTEAEGEASDEAVIKFADGTSKTLTLKGKVIGVPKWSITPESVDETVDYGTPLSKTFTVKNDGNEPLTFSMQPSDWVTINDQTTDDNSSMDYIYKSSTDYDDVTCDWVDLTKDAGAAHQDITYYYDKTDYYKVELPFEFPFYGKNYKTMYIYDTGFVSFSEHTDYKEFPEPPSDFPTTETFYTNIIAPFWGNHAMGEAEEDGTYYKVEDDHVVVSFVNYGNSMMLGFDFQVLLYKDGHYKFQYHLQDDGMKIGTFGLAGIQDETGKTGINLPQQCIEDGNAVEFYPVKSYTVPAGEGKEIATTIKTDELADEYDASVTFNTNVPTQPTVVLPVKLNITGEAKPVFPKSVGGEAVAATDDSWPTLTYDFQVANEGTKAFKITNVDFNADNSLPAYLLVYATYTDDLFGTTTTDWTAWYNVGEVTVGKEPVKFQIQYMDDGTVLNEKLPITFTLEGLDGTTTKVVPFKLNMTEAPHLTLDNADGLTIDTNDEGYDGTGKFTIGNDGKYKLTYTLRLDPNGIGETEQEDNGSDDGGGIAPAYNNVLAKAFSAGQGKYVMAERTKLLPAEARKDFVLDVPDIDYTQLLYYPMLDVENPSTYFMGTGSSNLGDNFLAATRYTAPAEGFNLSKLYFYGTIGNLKNVDIEASVVGSSDVTSDRVIGHGTLHVDKEDPAPGYDDYYAGATRILEFDKPVYINPNDTFYVVLKYPAGYPSSAALAPKADRVRDGRYMAWLGSYGWIDLGQEMYSQYQGSYGYFMTCIEEKAGKPWITLDADQKTEGEIAVGESLGVKVNINPESAYFDRDNKAVVVIKSNDPTQKLVNYPITFNQNSAPVITAPSGTTTVPEGSTAEMKITVADVEGDAFSVKVNDESGIAKVTSPEADAEGNISVAAGESLDMTVTLAPGYGTAGSYSLTVTATDAKGKTSASKIPYNVEFTNRAPVYEGDAEISIGKGQNTGILSFESLFTDPDGDAMTFGVTMPENSFAELLTSSSGFLISGNAIGETKVTLTATDANGATTTRDVPVKVVDATAIGSVTAGKDISVYPNPVVTTANVTLGAAATDVNYYVYDNSGHLMSMAHADAKAAGEPRQIDMSTFGAGVYRIKVTTSDGVHVVSVLKK